MSNEQQFMITVRFAGWTEDGHDYPAFGVKYLLKTPVIAYPDWLEDDKRWWTWNEEVEVTKRFIDWYKKNIKDNFDGEVLFIEPVQIVIADGLKDLHDE